MLDKRKQGGRDRWKHRRAMAWAAFACAMAFPFLLLFTESDQLGSVAGAFYIFVSAVVGAYIGFSTIDDKWQRDEYSSTSNSDRD